ncbi:hypothetical protein JRQ81_002589 [Phrynocephalus forsythii]|uniref:Uncharacterized protein n=1 Tax=Phrynocephalus forsythii TaxID=171643 RepID=A0A9Q1AW46_9SAUR|nr:hypothetical protein JRQ81_002589 [Phrynocephalus forsythii]
MLESRRRTDSAREETLSLEVEEQPGPTLTQIQAEMAPRIRLNLAKPLPTISEAFEDVLEDITSNTKSLGNVYLSPDSCSGEDIYLHSVGQQARPTFLVPPESKHKIQDINKPGMLHNNYRVLNMTETPKMIPRYTRPNMMLLERQCFLLDCIKTYSSSNMDPLEELCIDPQRSHRWRCPKGCENTDKGGAKHNFHGIGLVTSQETRIEKQDLLGLFSRLPSPRPQPREDGCPELRSLKNQEKMQTLKSNPNQKESELLIVDGKSVWLHPPKEAPPGAKVLRSQRGQPAWKTATCPEREKVRSSIYVTKGKREASGGEHRVRFFHSAPPAASLDWLSGYQSAWKEAKMRACLLPAIAES